MKEYYSCFIGVPLDYQFKYESELLQKKIQKYIPDGSIVEPHNLHLTLYYLGQQTEENLEEISHIIYEGKNMLLSERLGIGGIGEFDRKYLNELAPYVIFLRVNGSDNLFKFRSHLSAHLDFYNREEVRPFTPHVTLLRLKTTESRTQFENSKDEIINLLNNIKWDFAIKEIYIYGKSNLNSSKFQDKLFRIPIV